jgi:hypothetical protein
VDSLAAFVIASFVTKSFFTAVTSPEFEHVLCPVVYRDQVTGERFPHSPQWSLQNIPVLKQMRK